MSRFKIRCPECGNKTYQIDLVLEEGMCDSCLEQQEWEYEIYEDRRNEEIEEERR